MDQLPDGFQQIADDIKNQIDPELNEADAMMQAMQLGMKSIIEAVESGSITQEQLVEAQASMGGLTEQPETLPTKEIEEELEAKLPPITGQWGQRLARLLREYTDHSIHTTVKNNRKEYLLFVAPWRLAVNQVRSKQPPSYELMTTFAPNYKEVRKAMKNVASNQVTCVIEIPLNPGVSALEIFYIQKNFDSVKPLTTS